jgi:hypothetical protein
MFGSGFGGSSAQNCFGRESVASGRNGSVYSEKFGMPTLAQSG